MDGSSVSGAPNLRHPYTIRSRHEKLHTDAKHTNRAQTLSIQVTRAISPGDLPPFLRVETTRAPLQDRHVVRSG